MWHLPRWQVWPKKGKRQTHLYDVLVLKHVPAFWHGEKLQGSTSEEKKKLLLPLILSGVIARKYTLFCNNWIPGVGLKCICRYQTSGCVSKAHLWRDLWWNSSNWLKFAEKQRNVHVPYTAVYVQAWCMKCFTRFFTFETRRFIIKCNTFLIKSTCLKHYTWTNMTWKRTFCYFFGAFSGFIHHVFFSHLSETLNTRESYKCKFELAKLGEHF